MSHTIQFFFTKEKLEGLIKQFNTREMEASLGGKTLRGFVFTPGRTMDKLEDTCFAFPLFSDKVRAATDGDILVQNTDENLAGCPYPPPCETKKEGKGCYDE